MEEEPRRIQDVVNLLHHLIFPTWDEDDGGGRPSSVNVGVKARGSEPRALGSNPHGPVAIVESPLPLPLDEGY